MYSIGEIISTYRKKKGLLQQDLADELAKEGITISYKAISNWERNLAEPSVTIFYKVCRILGITNMYEAYFGVNPADPFSSLTDEGREKAMDYINLLHASGMYEKQTAKIIPFRSIDIFENAVSAGTGNFLVDGPKETVRIDESILPEDTTFGVRISGDSMEPEFHDGQIAWILQQESVANGEIGIFALNGEALDCQHFFRQIFLGYFSDIVQAFDTLRKNVCGDDYTSLHNPIVLSSVLPAYGMFHSIQILFL